MTVLLERKDGSLGNERSYFCECSKIQILNDKFVQPTSIFLDFVVLIARSFLKRVLEKN